MWPLWMLILLGGGFVAANVLDNGTRTASNQETANGPVFGVSSNYLSAAGVSDNAFIGTEYKPAGMVRGTREVPMNLNAFLNATGRSSGSGGAASSGNAFGDFLRQLIGRALPSNARALDYSITGGIAVGGGGSIAATQQSLASQIAALFSAPIQGAQSGPASPPFSQIYESFTAQRPTAPAPIIQQIAPNPPPPPPMTYSNLYDGYADIPSYEVQGLQNIYNTRPDLQTQWWDAINAGQQPFENNPLQFVKWAVQQEAVQNNQPLPTIPVVAPEQPATSPNVPAFGLPPALSDAPSIGYNGGFYLSDANQFAIP